MRCKVELKDEDAKTWNTTSFRNLEAIEETTKKISRIVILASWDSPNYRYMKVRWEDEIVTYRESLLPDTSAIYGALESCKLDYSKLANAIAEVLKKEWNWMSLEKSPLTKEIAKFQKPEPPKKPKTEIEILKDNGHWETTGWESFNGAIRDKEIISSFKILPNHRLLIVVLKYSNEIEVYREVSRAD